PCRLLAVGRLAASADRRETGDAHSVASKRIPVVVALEVAGARPATDSRGFTAADLLGGDRKSDLGRGRDCRRTPGQARHPSSSADRTTVYAIATTARSTGNTGMEHLRAEPRPGRPRQ